MNTIINGTEKIISDNLSITGLLDELKINAATVVIEKNSIIVDKTAYSLERVNEGDKIEIIRFMGGG